jgi:HlyD family secretion protein
MRAVLFVSAIALASCAAPSDGAILATGTIEVVETDAAPMVPAKVIRVWREEGDAVHAGDTLATLTQSATKSDVEARRARVEGALAQLHDLEVGPRPAELARGEADLRSAEADAVRTQQDLTRLTGLAASGTISQQQLDGARDAAASAAGRRDAARQTLALLRQGSRAEQISAARAEVDNARAALAAAEQTARDLVLVSPTGGVVTSRNAEPGDVLAAGASAMTIGDLARPFVRVYVGEAALPRIHLGDSVSAVLDGIPNRPFTGRVTAINSRAEYTPRVALTEEERADLVFGVKVAFTDATGMLKAGLPITVRFTSAGPVTR